LADKQEAFGMYLNGMSFRVIAEELNKRYDWGLSMRTVQKWAAKMGWKEELKSVEYELTEEVKKTIVKDVGSRMAEVEEVRQEFLGRLRQGNAEIRGHEFAKMTEMLNNMGDVQREKDELVEHINDCIQKALEEADLPRAKKQHFLRTYIALLRGDLSD
jgi:GMP synthase PP-ATPase subunit